MRRKAAVVLLATALIAVAGGLALTYREELAPYTDRVVALVPVGGAGEASAEPATPPAAPQVPVAEVITREVAPAAEYTGYVAAVESVAVRSRVGGYIETVSVPEGGLVEEGQLLFQIDPRPFQAALAEARARLAQAEAQLVRAEADFARAEELFRKGVVARARYDEAVANRRQLGAEVQAAASAVEAAELDLSYARITAPISGRVDRALVTRGNLVAGASAGAATLLTSIVSVDPVHVYFDIDEPTYLGFVGRARADGGGRATTLPAQVGLMTDKGLPHSGVLDFLGNQVDRSTGTVRARAVVPNPDGWLTPGLFARVKLVTDAPRRTVLIDDEAVGTDQGRRYVLVLGPDNKAEYRPVELGPVIDGLRVVASGLNPGETVIVKGLVRPGMQVEPRRVSMEPGPAQGGGGDLASREAVR